MLPLNDSPQVIILRVARSDNILPHHVDADCRIFNRAILSPLAIPGLRRNVACGKC